MVERAPEVSTGMSKKKVGYPETLSYFLQLKPPEMATNMKAKHANVFLLMI